MRLPEDASALKAVAMALIGEEEQRKRALRDAPDSGERKAIYNSFFIKNWFNIATLLFATAGIFITIGMYKSEIASLQDKATTAATKAEVKMVDDRLMKIESDGSPSLKAVKWTVDQHERELAAITGDNKGRDKDISEIKSDVKLVLRLIQADKRP